ncbi:TPA: hypothetical protein RCG80_002992 [Enterobacter roggenkampii]|nr:hypothetical protein [Enterobacter roggenkampii]
MKNPIEMLNDIAAEITENASLLEVIYRINEFSPEADNTIACLIRSMLKTSQTAYEYVEQLSMQDGAECQRGQQLESPTALANQLNSWSADIGNCRMALSNAMDCMPTELSAIGTLTIVYEKLDDLQETICKQADKI